MAAVDTMRQLSVALYHRTVKGPYKPFFFDLETDGLSPEHQILEVAVSTGPAAGAGGAAPRTFARLVRPLTPELQRGAAEVHGITMADVAGAGRWPVVATDLVRWLLQECVRTHPNGCVPVFIGHSITRFDLKRLGSWLAHLGLVVPVDWRFIDTHTLAQDLAKDAGALPSPNLKLATLAGVLGVPVPEKLHRAGADVAVNVGVFSRLAERWREGQDAVASGQPPPWQQQQQQQWRLPPWRDMTHAGQQAHVEALLRSNASFTGNWFPLVTYDAFYGTDPLVKNALEAASRAPAAKPAEARKAKQPPRAAAAEKAARAAPGAGAGAQGPRAAVPPPPPPPKAGLARGGGGEDARARAAEEAAAAAAAQRALGLGDAVGDEGSEGEEEEEEAAAAGGGESEGEGESDAEGGEVGAAVLLPWALDDPAEAVEAAVAKGLAALAAEDVDASFDPAALAGAWEPFTAGVGELAAAGALTAAQRERLASAELGSLLQVLLHAPRAVREYARAIDPAAGEGQLVAVEGRVVALSGVERGGDKPSLRFTATLEVPSSTPGAPPHRVRVTRYFPGRGRWLVARADGEWRQIDAARLAGCAVALRCKLQRGFRAGEWQAALSSPEPSLEALPTPWRDAEAAAQGAPRPPVVERIYPKCKRLEPADMADAGGIAERALRAVAAAAARGGGGEAAADPLPADISRRHELMGWLEALRGLHAPGSAEEHHRARQRVAFQEMFLGQLAAMLERRRLTAPPPELAALSQQQQQQQPREPGGTGGGGGDEASAGADSGAPPAAPLAAARRPPKWPITITRLDAAAAAEAALPYTLTNSQRRVLRDIQSDLAGPGAMMRLLQGDVGCGKTVVALLAMLAASGSGYQSLMMAPTELLAEQHYATLCEAAEQLPLALRPRVALVTNSLKPKERRDLSARIAAGHVDLVVGTQALLRQEWASLGLVVIDEQHKFGVRQREQLARNVGHPVHTLLMTATPIPRTLALVQYGSLVLSSINEMPPGRRPIKTRVVVDEPEGREEVYQAIREELASGGRVYIVCPLVSASTSASASAGARGGGPGDSSDGEGARAEGDPRRTVMDEFARLTQAGVFGREHRVGLLHGRLSGEEKARALKDFSSGAIPVLIASTVVEVGIDEPEASVMLVEDARRFGLAQLHQLRGRVGRGGRDSRCFLMVPPGDEAAAARLAVMERSHNGLHIAEADLRLRGPGDPFGVKQSGRGGLSLLCLTELRRSPPLMEHARSAAAEVLSSQRLTPQLKAALVAYGFWQMGGQDGGDGGGRTAAGVGRSGVIGV